MSGWELLVALAAIIGVPIGVTGLIYVARQQARDQASKRSDELQGKFNDGYVAGQAHVAPELNLMRSERDDARRERDERRDELKDARDEIRDLQAELRRKAP